MKEYKVRLKNQDGEQETLVRQGENLKQAQDAAFDDANSGYLPGKGWTVLWAREVEK